MSTMVAMPVRVKPPPAETGDTIAPTCASFDTTTPAKGARTVQLSRCCWATRMRASAALTCALASASRAQTLHGHASLIAVLLAHQFPGAQGFHNAPAQPP